MGTDASTDTLAASYDPGDIEARRYGWWEAQGFFAAEPDDDGEPFAIAMPPPNVTGSLHIGHALTTAIEDALVRHARMQGKNAVWLPGSDHAGIATQNVVERQLALEGTSRHELGRQGFLERMWAWVQESGGAILAQERRLGASADWRREAFTLDEPRSAAVRTTFCRLYDDGLVYKGERIINWCPRCQTALSDIEVEHPEVDGELASLRYPASDGGDGVVVATTRVETMLGDTGVAVHPDDERYRHLIGSTVVLPLLARELPVVADAGVDPEFGTGAVKVTPAHDPLDHDIGQRHGLEPVEVIGDDAAITEHGGPYVGLDRFAARERVKGDLAKRGVLEQVEARTFAVGHCSRCDTVVEPKLSEQWFVATRPLADRAIASLDAGALRFVPDHHAKGYRDWLANLHDWCISRQLWWGHRIPAWYEPDGTVHVRRQDPSEEEIERLGLTRDPDVLDTWFSSQLWPLTTLGWTGGGREETPELAAWYPHAIMETGYDINTFWVSRMHMIGLYLLDEVPFRVVFNHGMVRDEHGKKMSKSFGNVIDPLEFCEAYGADALRFALLRSASPGSDVPIAREWVEGGRRFCNKLWHAAKFTLGLLGEMPADGTPPPAASRTLEDRWLLSRLEATRAEAVAAYDEHDLARAARSLYHFTWDELCDWYVEVAKLRDDAAATHTLAYALDQVLRLLHPQIPFVTEELWQALWASLDGEADATALIVAPWPHTPVASRDDEAEAGFAVLQEAVTALRRFRSDHRLSPAVAVDVVAVPRERGSQQLAALQGAVEGLRRLAGVAGWRVAEGGEPGELGPTGRVSLSGVDLVVPLAGLIDLAEERDRLERELVQAEAEHERAQKMLANEGFVANAPADKVQAERDKVHQWRQRIDALTAQLQQLR
jgi:valyl-tRNA synthetase